MGRLMASLSEVQAAAAELAAAEQNLRRIVIEADAAGIPKAAIGRAAGLSRHTVIRWVDDTSHDSTPLQ